jgi:hypothetical protein
MLQARRSQVRVTTRSLGFFQFPNLPYGNEDDLTSNRNEYQKMFLGSIAWLACKADNLTTICEQNV